ncbi:MAG: tetraacyldisaccharide 4'-kinase [Planctomycetaceae bacterium]
MLARNTSATAIVLDDAFQHRRIHRDFNVVLIDATCPFGHDHLLPRGLLREPLSSLRRADAVLVTRADLADHTALDRIDTAVLRNNPKLADRIFRVSFVPAGLQTATGKHIDLTAIMGRRVVLAAAIGNPTAFRMTCETLGAQIAASRFFPDHHHFTAADIDEVLRLRTDNDCDLVLVTLKDLVKIPRRTDDLAAVMIDTAFLSTDDEESFRGLMTAAISNMPSKTS